MPPETPVASVIIPLYHSWKTLACCLDALAAQTDQRFETILVDSSGDELARAIAAGREHTVFLQSGERLRPQAARNHGAQRAQGRLLIFTDPDIYAAPQWVKTLIQRYDEAPAMLFGPIACYGRRWTDRAVHLVKFNICLPGGAPRPVRLGWSGNVLIDRETFGALGGWDTDHTQGDSAFTARARAAGYAMRMEPEAIVFHDHEGVSLRAFFRERFLRGREFARMEATGALGPLPAGAGGGLDVAGRLAAMPLRALGSVRRVAKAAGAAGMFGDFLLTSPAVLLGLAGWYAGLADGWRRGGAD